MRNSSTHCGANLSEPFLTSQDTIAQNREQKWRANKWRAAWPGPGCFGDVHAQDPVCRPHSATADMTKFPIYHLWRQPPQGRSSTAKGELSGSCSWRRTHSLSHGSWLQESIPTEHTELVMEVDCKSLYPQPKEYWWLSPSFITFTTHIHAHPQNWNLTHTATFCWFCVF